MKTRLRGITWDHPRGYEGLQHATSLYVSSNDNMEIEWEKHSLRHFEAYPIPELADKYDLIILDHPFMGDVNESKCLVDLSDYEAELDLDRQAADSAGSSFNSYRYGGHLWALPIDAASQASAYRHDLAGDDFRPPLNLTEVREFARHHRLAIGLHSVHSFLIFVALCAQLGPLPSYSNDYDGHYVEELQGLEALEWLKELASYCPPEALEWNAIHCLDAMRSRDDLAYCPFIFSYSSYSRPDASGKYVTFANIPGIRGNKPIGSVLGGTGIAISRRCANITEALRFVHYVTSTDVQIAMGLHNGQPARRSAWTDDRLNLAYHQFYRNTADSLLLAYRRPQHPGYMGFQNEGAKIVDSYLRGEISDRNSIKRINEAYERTLQRKRYEGEFM